MCYVFVSLYLTKRWKRFFVDIYSVLYFEIRKELSKMKKINISDLTLKKLSEEYGDVPERIIGAMQRASIDRWNVE